jgi:hypothetical protein
MDWRAVFFYVSLFALVGGLEKGGAIEVVAHWMIPFIERSLLLGTTLFYWVSAGICGIVEHDAYILTLLYVIRDLAAAKPEINPWPLYWALLWAGTLGSNLTIAGAPGPLCRGESRGKGRQAESAAQGVPARVPVDEDHPLDVLAARKPAYGIAKEFAEKLVLLAGQAGMSSTVLRFWWAFGEEIGGRHLREMLWMAADGKVLAVPADCGGSFLAQEDFNLAVETILRRPATPGRVFNLASAYLGWDEVARMVAEVTAGTGGIESVPRTAWRGAAFLADRWELDDRRIRSALGFAPVRDAADVRLGLRWAIAATWQRLQAQKTGTGT